MGEATLPHLDPLPIRVADVDLAAIQRVRVGTRLGPPVLPGCEGINQELTHVTNMLLAMRLVGAAAELPADVGKLLELGAGPVLEAPPSSAPPGSKQP